MKSTKPRTPSRARQPDHEHRETALLRRWLLSPAAQLALILIAGVAVYANTFGVPFVLDDVTSIYGNPAVRNFQLAFRPRLVGDLSFALNYRFSGMNVFGYHLVNLIIHLGNGGLVYALLQLLLRSPACRDAGETEPGQRLLPFFAALLFVVHPLQTQAVTYLAQRVASLATLFYLATLVLWLLARSSGARAGRLLLFSAALATAILAMGTKEIACTLPLTILLLETVFPGTTRKRLLPVFFVAATTLVIPLAFQEATAGSGGVLALLRRLATPTTVISRGDYFLTQLNVLATYLRLFFLPYGQNLDYDYPIAHTLLTPATGAAALLLAAMVAGALLLLYRAGRTGRPGLRLIGFGILWFFITIALESSFIPLPDVIFEHRLYLPSIGLCTALVAAVLEVRSRLAAGKRAAAGWLLPLLGLAALLLALTAAARNEVWRDEVSLWKDVVAKSPAKARAHGSLGSAYQRLGLLDDAVREYEAAVALDPGDAASCNNLGTIYQQRRQWDAAARSYRRAVTLNPENVKIRSNMGTVLAELGKLDEAELQLREALRRKPDYDAAHNSLGIVYAKRQQLAAALAEFREAARLNPGNASAIGNAAALSGARH